MEKSSTNIRYDTRQVRKIIDMEKGDGVVIDTFLFDDTDSTLDWYKSLGTHENVEIDCDGDIILSDNYFW